MIARTKWNCSGLLIKNGERRLLPPPDLLSQAEHDEMAAAVLLTPNENLAHEVSLEVDKQLKTLITHLHNREIH